MNHGTELPVFLEYINHSVRTEVEIGSGNGHFISAYALRHESAFFLCVELKKVRCLKILKKVEQAGLKNVVVHCGRAESVLNLLRPQTVDAFHVYFPDPWPKTKQRKHRFMRRENIALLHAALKPGGQLFFASDLLDYFLQAKILCLLQGGFAQMEIPLPEEALLSLFSGKTRSVGKPVYSLVMQKTGS